ncbi:MAG: hypothetical protein KDC34_03395 [Saprospiraceae bacterium]|nr:hypothetical protein [Saprospiraceae bacterium]
MIDADGDGWVNECVPGGDCDDSNGAINPDVIEICANGIDDDCDGYVDEADSDCLPACIEGEVVIDFNGPLFVAPADEPGVYSWQEAVDRCNSKVTDGCDWYLPTKDELNAMYLARNEIGGFDQSGNDPTGYYWSSTLYEGLEWLYGWDQRFSDGFQAGGWIEYGFNCRCVRR